jgi:phosphatidylserine synthase
VAPPAVLYLGMTVGIRVLTVSTIPFPALAWILARWRSTVMVLGLMGVSLVGLSFLTAWLLSTSAYVGVSLVRASAQHVR